MLRCGFGLKDAPRLWNKVLRALLEDIGMRPLQSDEQLFVWHETTGRSDAPNSSKASDTEVFAPTLRMILSTHVDDMKGAGQPEYKKRLLLALEKKFGQLKLKEANFECVGVMHESSADGHDVWTHQQHYVGQIKAIPIGGRTFAKDDEAADDDMKQLYMSLVGALAWLVLTIPAICIYVAALQRHTQAPTLKHVKDANRLLEWIRKNLKQLGIRFKQLAEPLRLVCLSDSAFKAQEFEGLVMRGCVIFLASATPAGRSGVSTDSQGCKPWTTGTDVQVQLLDWYSKKHTRVVRSTYAAELLSLLDAVNQGHVLKLCLHEVICGAQPAAKLINTKKLAIPLDAGVDARSVFDSATAQQVRTPADKQLILHVRALREHLDEGLIDVFYWIDTEDMLPDGMTKGSIDRKPLLALANDGVWSIRHDDPVYKVLKAE